MSLGDAVSAVAPPRTVRKAFVSLTADVLVDAGISGCLAYAFEIPFLRTFAAVYGCSFLFARLMRHVRGGR